MKYNDHKLFIYEKDGKFLFSFSKETYRMCFFYGKKKFIIPEIKPLTYVVRKIKFFRKYTLPESLNYIKMYIIKIYKHIST